MFIPIIIPNFNNKNIDKNKVLVLLVCLSIIFLLFTIILILSYFDIYIVRHIPIWTFGVIGFLIGYFTPKFLRKWRR